MEEKEIILPSNDKIDELEAAMMEYPPADCDLFHSFTPGLYIRTLVMPAGSLITSMKHKTTHPFYVLYGKASVFSDNDGVQIIEAPYDGITTKGTCRVLYIHEKMIWTTHHPLSIVTGEEDSLSQEDRDKAIDVIEDLVFERRENAIIGGSLKNNVFVPSVKEIEEPV